MIFYRDRAYQVSATSLKTPRRTFRMKGIEQTNIRRPILIGAAMFWLGGLGITGAFHPILYDYEILALFLGPVLFMPIAAQIAVLQFQYRGMGGEGRIWGFTHRLKKVRAAIDQAIEEDIGAEDAEFFDRRASS